MNQNLDLNAQKNKFMDFIFKSKKSEKTIENYDRYLNFFLKHTDIKHANELNLRIINNYKTTLEKHGLNAKTQNYHLSALRMFVKFLQKNDKVSFDFKDIKLKKVKNEKIFNNENTNAEDILLFAEGEDIKSLRDRAILRLLLFSGVKVSELCSLNRNVDLTSKELKIYKNNSNLRIVEIDDETKKLLEDYLTLRSDMDDALFVNNGRRKSKDGTLRITPRTVQRIVKFYAKKADIPNIITPSKLRHFFAQKMLENKTDIATLRNMLGYKNTSTVKKYIKELPNS